MYHGTIEREHGSDLQPIPIMTAPTDEENTPLISPTLHSSDDDDDDDIDHDSQTVRRQTSRTKDSIIPH